MKTIAILALAGAAFIATSCQQQQQVKPIETVTTQVLKTKK